MRVRGNLLLAGIAILSFGLSVGANAAVERLPLVYGQARWYDQAGWQYRTLTEGDLALLSDGDPSTSVLLESRPRIEVSSTHFTMDTLSPEFILAFDASLLVSESILSVQVAALRFIEQFDETDYHEIKLAGCDNFNYGPPTSWAAGNYTPWKGDFHAWQCVESESTETAWGPWPEESEGYRATDEGLIWVRVWPMGGMSMYGQSSPPPPEDHPVWYLDLKDFAIEGEVVPEPVTLFILALGSLGLLRRRRA